MLGDVTKRVPMGVRKLIKPSRCYDDDRKLGHDWGSIFLFEDYSIKSVYGFPQPPHLLPKYIPKRLGIIEFF